MPVTITQKSTGKTWSSDNKTPSKSTTSGTSGSSGGVTITQKSTGKTWSSEDKVETPTQSTTTTDPQKAGTVGNVLKGAAKSTASGYANAGGTLLELLGKLGSALQDKKEARLANQDQEYLKQNQAALAEAKAKGDEQAAKLAQIRINQAQYRLKNSGALGDYYDSVNQEAASKVYSKADELASGAAKDIEMAKTGKGKVGSFLVDTGVAGAQLAGDVGLAALTGGTALAPMAVRSFGSATQEARQSGASLGQQVAYGAGSSAVSVATERLANLAAPFKKAFGSGLLDQALGKVAEKPSGMLLLSALSEGGEEILEAVAQPALQRLTYDPDATYDADWLADALYSGGIGAVLGGIGGAVTRRPQQEAATAQTAAQGGNVAPTVQNVTEATQNAAPEVGTAGGIKAGQVTTIRDPYRGEVPTQTARQRTTPVQVSRDSLTTAQNRIAGARGLESSMPGQSFKGALKNAYKGVFKAAKGVQVEGMTFNGQPYTVDINSNVPGKVISDVNLTAEKLALLDNLTEVVQNGAYVGSGEYVQHGSRNKPVQRYDYFETPVTINGEQYIARFDVEAYPTVNNYRTHQITKIDLIQSEGRLAGPTPVPSSEVSGHSEGTRPLNVDSTIAQDAENVKIDPLLQLLSGGKRAELNTLTEGQQNAVYQANEAGTVGMDAAGRVFQIDPEQHIDRRTTETVGSRDLNAFQFDHPELHRYYQQAANALIADAELSQQFPMNRSYERGAQGNRVNQSAMTSEHLRRAMDETGLSRREIIDAAQRIVNDQGQENVKAAKQVEVILDDMLTHGWTPMMDDPVAPNDAYIRAKAGIAGSMEGVEVQREALPVRENDGIGAADAGSLLPGQPGQERTSRLAESLPYNRWQEAATGLSREDYARLFRYQSQTESRSLGLAEELLYMMKDGRRTFLLDVDPAAFQAITDELRDATAWNGPQMDAARMIQQELQGRAANLEVSDDIYIDWLKTVREHETATGQGVQANAKWSRNDNANGQASELDAWKSLENSRLPEDQKRELFRRIVQLDTSIEAVPSGDTAAMKNIVMEVARERGTVSGPFGKAFAKLAESSLDSLTFDQMKQFAYSSTSALAMDSTPANAGEKLKTVQVLNMLSSPKTAARNLLGNTTFYGIDAAAMDVSALLDTAVSRLTGTRSIARERSPLGRKSLSDAAKAMQMSIAEITLDVDMGGELSRYGSPSSRTFKAKGTGAFNTNTAADRFLERALSAVERNQAYLLTATDEFYKGAARGTAENTQRLVDSGDIKTSDSEYAAKQAEQLAKYRTFQDDSNMSVAIQTIHDVLNLVGVGDSGKTLKGKTVHAFGAGDIVAPFTRVAGNLVSRGVEYSPVNAARGFVETARLVVQAAGGKQVDPAVQSRAVSALGRGATGTVLAYGAMVLAKMGLLRQADDEGDEDVAALNQSEGISGTQLNLTAAERALRGESAAWQYGDTLVDLASVEPLNLLLNLGTEMAKGGNPLLSSFTATVDSAMDAAVELPVMQTIGNFTTDVIKYGNDPKEVLAEETARTLLSSVTPNAVASLAKGLDDRPRNSYSGDGLLDLIQDTFKSRTPGLRETLPGSVNTLGEEKIYQEGEAGLLNAMLNPIGVNTYTQSDVSKEMERVREATGDAGFYPSKKIPTELTSDGKTVSLDYEARQDFQRDRGAVMLTATAEMMGSSRYKSADDATKAALLNKVHDYAYQSAKANVLGEDAVEKWVLNAKTAKQDIGVSTAEYIALYEKYGGNTMSGTHYEKVKKAVSSGLTVDEYVSLAKQADADGNGRVSKAEAKAALADQPKRADLWDIICTTNAKNPYA